MKKGQTWGSHERHVNRNDRSLYANLKVKASPVRHAETLLVARPGCLQIKCTFRPVLGESR